MKKHLSILSLCLIVIIISGCSKSDSGYSSTSPSNNSNYNSSLNNNSSVTESANSENKLTSIDTSDIQGDILNIYYANKNEILILADKLYLYDLNSGNVLSETEKKDFMESTYFAIENGYVAVGMLYDNNEGGTMTTSEISKIPCIIFDKDLNIEFEINIGDLLAEDEYIYYPEQITVNKDGSKIAFATDCGLFIYDTNTSLKNKLIDLLDDNESSRYGLSSIEKVAFVSDDNALAFKSLSNDVPAIVGKESYDTYGIINVDGSHLTVNEGTDSAAKDMIAYDSKLFLFDNSQNPSGNIMIYDIVSSSVKTINLLTDKEGCAVFGSEFGTYFVTSVVNDDNITIRVYETGTESLVMEQIITEESEYMYREPEIKIIDELKTCVVLLGNRQTDISTKILVYNFD